MGGGGPGNQDQFRRQRVCLRAAGRLEIDPRQRQQRERIVEVGRQERSEVGPNAERGTKVYAIGPVSGQNAPNINVIVTSGAGAPTGDAFASAVVGQAKQELSSVGATHVTASVVHSQLGATAQSTYTLPSSISKGSPLAGYQIYALHGSRVYVVTITTTSAALDRSVANKVKGSWTWK
jgi:hypothetical protein